MPNAIELHATGELCSASPESLGQFPIARLRVPIALDRGTRRRLHSWRVLHISPAGENTGVGQPRDSSGEFIVNFAVSRCSSLCGAKFLLATARLVQFARNVITPVTEHRKDRLMNQADRVTLYDHPDAAARRAMLNEMHQRCVINDVAAVMAPSVTLAGEGRTSDPSPSAKQTRG